MRQNRSAAVLARPWAPAAWPIPLGTRAAPSPARPSARAPSATARAHPPPLAALGDAALSSSDGSMSSIVAAPLPFSASSTQSASPPSRFSLPAVATGLAGITAFGDPISSPAARWASPLTAGLCCSRACCTGDPATPDRTGLRSAMHSEMNQSSLACLSLESLAQAIDSTWRSRAFCSALAARSAIVCRSLVAMAAALPMRSSSSPILRCRSAHASASSFAS